VDYIKKKWGEGTHAIEKIQNQGVSMGRGTVFALAKGRKKKGGSGRSRQKLVGARRAREKGGVLNGRPRLKKQRLAQLRRQTKAKMVNFLQLH